jgi:hypothetical protein
LVLLDVLCLLVGRARPAQLPVGVGQHQSDTVRAEQLLGCVYDLLQGTGQATLELQLALRGDADNQVGGIDGQGALLR